MNKFQMDLSKKYEKKYSESKRMLKKFQLNWRAKLIKRNIDSEMTDKTELASDAIKNI